MDGEIKNALLDRNTKILEIVTAKIQRCCPECVDLIGIAGSFCSGDIHEKSDLDLVIIINDDRAKVLNVCFILEDVGFDIYTSRWNRLEGMSNYNSPYVTKLKDLDIVFTKNEEVVLKYKNLGKNLKAHMSDGDGIKIKVGKHFGDVLSDYEELLNSSDKGLIYTKYASIIVKIEYIMYMLNRSYVKLGIRRIQEEIANLGDLPKGFLEEYLDIVNFKDVDEVKHKCSSIIDIVGSFLIERGIDVVTSKSKVLKLEKREISKNDLIGTYEEIFSNWYNKMVLARKTRNAYLSFMTMASTQGFYDEMYQEFDIDKIELISKYDFNDLNNNVRAFETALSEWKLLYDKFELDVLKFDSIDGLSHYYSLN